MKIGVITQHRVNNWGSFLQAYATQLFIEKSTGMNCEIIDYVYPNSFQYAHYKFSPHTLKSRIIDIANWLKISNIQRKADRLNLAVNKSLNLSKKYQSFEDLQKESPKYDLYITGSDQTLNPKFTFGDTNFLFSWVKDEKAKIISFASSMPGRNFPVEYEPLYKRLLSRYDVISVRENNCVNYLERLTGKKVYCHIDPTLLLRGDEWIHALSHLKQYRKINYNYILIYKINHTTETAPYIYNLTKWLQEQSGLKVVSIGSSIPKCYGIKSISLKDIGPLDFVNLFKNSNYVVTSSFHGTAFAINFGRPLYSVVPANNNNDSRQSNLLKMIDAQNCIVPLGAEFININPNYDVLKCQNILERKRKEMMDFICSFIK